MELLTSTERDNGKGGITLRDKVNLSLVQVLQQVFAFEDSTRENGVGVGLGDSRGGWRRSVTLGGLVVDIVRGGALPCTTPQHLARQSGPAWPGGGEQRYVASSGRLPRGQRFPRLPSSCASWRCERCRRGAA